MRGCRERNLIKAFHHRPGEAYLLRADRCLHRVTELAPQRQRKALNLGFEATATPKYGITATRLYGETDSVGNPGEASARAADPPLTLEATLNV